MNKFWMVWNPVGRAPVYRHESRASAEREAERLAKLNPTNEFYILEALGFLRKRPEVEKVTLCDNESFNYSLEEII